MSCCSECGNGCQGGFPPEAFNYWINNGLVTGNEYGGQEWCSPYSFPMCAHHTTNPKYPACGSGELYPTPTCQKSCSSKTYAKSYQDDLIHGTTMKSFDNADDIAIEIMENGPVVTSFSVYEDFEVYKGGIYQHHEGKALGGHAVRTIGFGTENGVQYWLVANSWNETWGENGLFRIIRGQNNCGFEESVVSGHARQ